MTTTVRDHAERRRYELEVGGALAFIDYRRDGRIVTMTYAEVPAALRGRGVGSVLVQGALELVRERGERVIAQCSFVAHYMRRHAEVHDLMAGADRGEATPRLP
jgi:predicted GNAT family acetyltransferase